MTKTDIVDLARSVSWDRITLERIIEPLCKEIERLRSPIPDAAVGEAEMEVPSGRDAPSDDLSEIERYARIIYDMEPFYEGGEYVDSFQVSPGGNLTWEQAKARDAEFGDDPRIGKITAFAYKTAAAIAADRQLRSAEREVFIPESARAALPEETGEKKI